jgi:hypothetical protein
VVAARSLLGYLVGSVSLAVSVLHFDVFHLLISHYLLARETYVCDDCEEKELPVLKDGPGSSVHRVDHSLLRIHNLEPVHFENEKLDATVTRIKALESDMNQRFADLESTIETRISTLESKVDARLASFESLLRRIALKLDVCETDGAALEEIGSGDEASKETHV